MQKKLTLVGTIIVVVILGFWLLSPTAKTDQQIKAVSPKEASTLINQHIGDPDFVILDIRTPKEYQSGHIENSIMIDFYSKTFAADVSRLDKEKTYLIYCRSGNRSARSMELFKKLEFKKVFHLSSGINSWKSEGLPLVK